MGPRPSADRGARNRILRVRGPRCRGGVLPSGRRGVCSRRCRPHRPCRFRAQGARARGATRTSSSSATSRSTSCWFRPGRWSTGRTCPAPCGFTRAAPRRTPRDGWPASGSGRPSSAPSGATGRDGRSSPTSAPTGWMSGRHGQPAPGRVGSGWSSMPPASGVSSRTAARPTSWRRPTCAHRGSPAPTSSTCLPTRSSARRSATPRGGRSALAREAPAPQSPSTLRPRRRCSPVAGAAAHAARRGRRAGPALHHRRRGSGLPRRPRPRGTACGSRPVAVVKRGPEGATLLARTDGGPVVRLEVATRPLPAADTTGAGDAFDAGFLAAWLALDRSNAPGALRRAVMAGHRAAARQLAAPRAELALG